MSDLSTNHHNSESQPHRFSADRPIERREQDLLGRAAFAEALASAIMGWKGNESLVIALYGPWGSGKSSVKNMVLESFRPDNANSPLIVEFNPWQWSGQNQLAEAFFQEIGLVLGRSDGSEDGKRRAAKWRTYGTYLTLGASLAKSLKTILPILGLPGSGIADMLVEGLEHSGNVMEEGSKGLEDQEVVHQQNLAELKRALSDSLKNLEQPILVVLDDIDRLTPKEIRLLFQLVKANADFPNLVYFLLFQRDIVERSLSSSPAIDGHEFLEKIVQLGFDIPTIERTRLKKLLLDRLEGLLGDDHVRRHFDEARWNTLFPWGLWPYFQTLRDVYRYWNSLAFHFSMFKGLGGFEVNPVDLCALEVLRVFEPEVYRRLPTLKSDLLNVFNSAQPPVADPDDYRRNRLKSLVKKATNRQPARFILKELFPTTAGVFHKMEDHPGMDPQWYQELRICHPKVFDRYFLLNIPEGDIPHGELDRLLSLAADRDSLVAEFQAFKERGQLDALLDRLHEYRPTVPAEARVPFITALLDIGDDILELEAKFLRLRPDQHASHIILRCLLEEQDQGSQSRIFQDVLTHTTGIYSPMALVNAMDLHGDQIDNRLNMPGYSLRLTDSDVDELKRLCIQKIETAAEQGNLQCPPDLSFLKLWHEWGSPDRVREWVARHIQSDEGLLSFLNTCIRRSIIARGNRTEEVWEFDFANVNSFVSFETLEERVNALDLDHLGDSQKRVVETFRAALQQQQEGSDSETS